MFKYNNNKILFLVEDFFLTQILILIYLSHNVFETYTKKNEENVKKTYVIVFKSTQ